MGNDILSSKQVGSQASRRVTRRLAWIQPVCISINAVPALKGLKEKTKRNHYKLTFIKIIQPAFQGLTGINGLGVIW